MAPVLKTRSIRGCQIHRYRQKDDGLSTKKESKNKSKKKAKVSEREREKVQ